MVLSVSATQCVKRFPRLVKADVAVMAQAKQLEIDAAERTDHLVVPGAFLSGVRLHAVGNVDAFRRDIDGVEKIFVHEIVVTLVVIPAESLVFVEVDGAHLRKIDVPFMVPLDQLLIRADRT